MKERILITGGNGFIGNRLGEMLEERGLDVIKLDRNALTFPDMLAKVMDEVRPEAVYHLAAYGNHYNQKEPQKIFNANLLGTFNLLESVRDRRIKYFVNTGSSSEYGRKDFPMKEDMIPETDSLYGAMKVGATYLAKTYAAQFGVPVVTVRPFSVYGPGEAEHRFIPTVIRNCLAGDALTVSPGVHDWIYIDDFVKGMFAVTENIKDLSGEVINIGTGAQHTNMEIVSLIENLCGTKINIVEAEGLRKFDTTTSWVADNRKLRSLGWLPEVDLREGIEKVIHSINK